MTTDGRGRDLAARMGLAPIGSRRIEMLLAGMASLFGLLFAATTIPALVADWPDLRPGLTLMLAVAVYGSIVVAALAALLHQWTRAVFGGVGLVYFGALALWPATIGHTYVGDTKPWLFALAGVPCALVVVASRWAVAAVYVLLVSVSTVGLRLTASGGAATLGSALLDGAAVFEVGISLLLIVVAVRRAAKQVDSAQGAALSRYADAQIDEATESERVRTDALVHDSVLTTFLSAAGAHTPEAQRLAARMAKHTMGVLSRATVASSVGPKVPLGDLLDRIREESGAIGDAFTFSTQDVDADVVPENVADALVSAAVQAMTNSVKHAGGPEVRRSVLVKGTGQGAVCVHVEDEGRGFDPAKVASERLGLRVSIIERMSRVSGAVDLRTALGEGTTFVLSWPAGASAPAQAPADGEAVLA
ncbi:sensor histidine kinase [Amnibacterium kyonggiense]|uniref:Signal transduction histidine kinase n=1 Tax=Amnibacterium kyonggiense TaxID=595671 RepID=A0A4R7FIR8_9MICO|nr:ATP-binding protein [Amnibacterium kyonggiense]TDS74998.1 signal transduction histidine kinase [Amnibacterium kyonggiense]